MTVFGYRDITCGLSFKKRPGYILMRGYILLSWWSQGTNIANTSKWDSWPPELDQTSFHCWTYIPGMLCYSVLKNDCFSKPVTKTLSSWIKASLKLYHSFHQVFHFWIYISPKSQALRGSISKSSIKYKNKTKKPTSRLLTAVCLWFLHKQYLDQGVHWKLTFFATI